MSSPSRFGAAAILATGIALAGFFIGGALSDIRKGAQIVSVKGLAEREVKADFVNWSFTFTTSGEELPAVQTRMQAAQNKVTAFLGEVGLRPDEDFRFTPWRVTDSRAQNYSGNPSGDRYIMETTVQITTAQVDAASKAAGNTAQLLSQGVLLGGSSLNYVFSDINAVKPDLIAQATKQARLAAEQFASDSQATVGGISRASQGAINIRVRGQDYDDPAQPNKIIRVVTTIDYLLQK